jgi:hypothetical protein
MVCAKSKPEINVLVPYGAIEGVRVVMHFFGWKKGDRELPRNKKCVKKKQDKLLLSGDSDLNIGFSNIFYTSNNQLCAALLCWFALK